MYLHDRSRQQEGHSIRIAFPVERDTAPAHTSDIDGRRLPFGEDNWGHYHSVEEK